MSGLKEGISGPSGRGVGVQIQGVVLELTRALQNVYFENVYAREIVINQVRLYAQNLEVLLARWEQPTNDFAVQEVRESVAALRRAVEIGAGASSIEWRNQVLLRIQTIANSFERLSQGTIYD